MIVSNVEYSLSLGNISIKLFPLLKLILYLLTLHWFGNKSIDKLKTSVKENKLGLNWAKLSSSWDFTSL